MVIRATYDAPWKEALDTYLQWFLELGFPKLAQRIDWAKGYESLEKELSAIAFDNETGTRTVDKLIKVWQIGGEETWALLHLELQAQLDAGFAERMWIYYYRLYDRYRKPIVSIAILADDKASWRPSAYTHSVWGCQVQFEFLMIKLLDFETQQVDLAASANPFSVIILAHLTALRTTQDVQARFTKKLILTRSLYSKGLDKTGILNLYSFIDAVLALPSNLELEYLHQVEEYEREQNMPYITSAERIGLEKGLEQGRIEGIEETKREIAKKLLVQGLSFETVSQITELPLLDIQRLAQEIQTH